jgi:hypothetical protein
MSLRIQRDTLLVESGRVRVTPGVVVSVDILLSTTGYGSLTWHFIQGDAVVQSGRRHGQVLTATVGEGISYCSCFGRRIRGDVLIKAPRPRLPVTVASRASPIHSPSGCIRAIAEPIRRTRTHKPGKLLVTLYYTTGPSTLFIPGQNRVWMHIGRQTGRNGIAMRPALPYPDHESS